MDDSHDHLLTLAAKIVSAHVGNHDTPSSALPNLIRDVYNSLRDVEPQEPSPQAVAMRPVSAGPTRGAVGKQTVFSDRLTCLECGLTMKMLKRHLITVHDLSPDQYRQKWGLPSNYALVASDYAKLRSSLAKQSGLGKRPESKTGRRR